MTGHPGHRRSIAIIAVGLAVALIVVGALIVAPLWRARSAAPGATFPRATGATTVRRRDLVVRDTESGTLAYAGQRTVYGRLGGTITWLPAVGTVIHPGQPLYRVDDEPVLLLDGTVPAFRSLTPSDDDGPDVEQLNRDLVALGDDPYTIEIDDEWQPATTAGVEALQKRLGEVETGTLTLGQIVFEPGPQLVASRVGPVGSQAPGGGGAPGDAAGPATPVLDTTSTRLVVTVDLDPSVQREARIGERVAVELPDGSTVTGHVTAVSPIAQSHGGAGAGSSIVPVTVTLDHRAHGGGLDDASVSVRFVRHRARNVLSVPVTALLATAGDRFAIREADAPGRLISVTTGVFAGGDVQISGRGVHPGLRVTDSQG